MCESGSGEGHGRGSSGGLADMERARFSARLPPEENPEMAKRVVSRSSVRLDGSDCLCEFRSLDLESGGLGRVLLMACRSSI